MTISFLKEADVKVCPKCRGENPKLLRYDMHGAIFGCEKCTMTKILIKETENEN